VPRIKLIVTGHTEEKSLHRSLQRLFPANRGGTVVDWLNPSRLNGTTTYRLQTLSAGQQAPEVMKLMAKTLMQEAVYGKDRPADLVIAIDDVELGNRGQEFQIARTMRTAMTQAIAELPLDRQAMVRQVVRERCSFHVLCPMIESYFFGERGALTNAGVSIQITPRLTHPTDVEDFESCDPDWLKRCQTENAKSRPAMPWWRHEKHPKHYLDFLVDKSGNEYDEVEVGATTLGAIAWAAVPKVADDFRFARCLFQDLADWFGVANPVMPGRLDPAFYPQNPQSETLILRNM
jgi:hypothetical protein